MLDKKNSSIQEYKLVFERINVNEARRTQMIIFGGTAFAAIFGFSNRISPLLIPISLTVVLLLVAREYSIQSVLQKINSAFILERYEENSDWLVYAKGNADMLYNEGPVVRFAQGLTDPILILWTLSTVGCGYFGWTAWKETSSNSLQWLIIPYLILIAILHAMVVILVISHQKRDLNTCREQWTTYFNSISTSSPPDDAQDTR